MKLGHYVLVLLIVGKAMFGGYCLWLWRTVRSWEALRQIEFLYPANRAPSACLDPQVYLGFLRPRLLILGIWLVLGAVVSTLLWALGPTPFIGALALLLWMLSSSLLYMTWMTMAARHYWP